MVRYRGDRIVLSVRIGATIVSCIALLPFFFASFANALSIDPTFDSVVSVTHLGETNMTTANQDRGRGDQKSDHAATPSAVILSEDTASQSSTPAISVTIVPMTPVIAEPIEYLPAVSTPNPGAQVGWIAQPVTTLATSNVGDSLTRDSSAMLQASEHGWKLLGMAWYWWGSGALLAYYISRHSMRIWRLKNATRNAIVS